MNNMSGNGNLVDFRLSSSQYERIRRIIEDGEGIPCEIRVRRTGVAGQTCEATAVDVDNYETEFVVHFTSAKRVIVDTVVLTRRRVGTFTRLMSYLFDIIHGTHYDVVEIQSALTPEMVQWCRSHGFVPAPGHTFDVHGCGGSYISDAQHNLYFEGERGSRASET